MSTEADGPAPRPAGEDDAPPMLSPHETWLATVGFVAVLAAALATFSIVKIINSGGKVVQAIALALSLATLAGVAALATSMANALRAADDSTEDPS